VARKSKAEQGPAVEREGLTDCETTKARLAEIRQIEAKMKAEEKEVSARTVPKPPSKGGRPKKKTSKRNVAAEAGTSHTKVPKMEKQVEIAEEFPFLQRKNWGREQTLKAGKLMESFSADEQIVVGAMLADLEQGRRAGTR
jgi:hypothetical protein